MRLQDLPLNPETLQALQSANETVESLLCHPFNEPHNSLPQHLISDAHAALHRVAVRASPSLKWGTSLLTPCASFNHNVGLPSTTVLQLYGTSLAGKTMICISLAAAVLKQTQRVIWLDTCAGEWLLRAAVSNHSDAQIDLLTVRTATNAPQIVHQLRALISELPSLPNAPMPRLLIFDSPASVLSPVLGLKGPNGWSGHTAMQQITTLISRFITLSSATVVVTNRVVDSATRPALGNIWSNFVDVHLFCQRVDAHEQRLELRLTVTSKRAPTSTFSVLITDQGMTDNDVEQTQIGPTQTERAHI
ncbi:DNA repair protein RAD51-like [Gracilariopsis chorda]|uniref:DNA repair protein RAD51-like n=1 Tax=Gracilariopsis chorda TaxID=448386 RepID=A0A2V3IW10_9FLOR|nr:DNA repair protein RAD51-like [Gracilariopsis chorda]|eukprot:PXF46324.1 DNA repair protein RAD51-like [Gracilariopsis chorda]